MKALVYDGTLSLKELDVPVPKKDEALIRVELAGICNTDLEVARGYLGFSGVLGHEFVGVVEACDDRSIVGKRVVGEINIPCGDCEYCSAGLQKHCRNISILGISKWNGAFAEYVVLPINNLHIVPEAVPGEKAVFVEPLAAALHVFESVWVKPSSKLMIIGDGKLGLLISMVASSLGISHTLVGKHPERFALVENRLTRTVYNDESLRLLQSHDIIVEATGNEHGMKLALNAVKPTGIIVLKSTYAHTPSVDLSVVAVNELRIVGSRCGPFREAIEFLEQGRVDPMRLIECVFDFDQAVDAARFAQSRLKVLLRMWCT